MAYNEQLANRIRESLVQMDDVTEKVMFGGLCFMVNEKMCVGVVKDEMMCRINPEIQEEALERIGAREMDFTKKTMKGFVYVNEDGLNSKADFEYWINLCLAFNPLAKASKKKKS